MRVKCLINDLSSLHNFLVLNRLQRSIHIDGEIADLKIGEVYNVLAIEEIDEGVWIYLHTVEENDYPFPYPIEFFEVMDNSLPTGWSLSIELQGGKSNIKRMSFCEWANGASFYERLVDGDAETVFLYRSIVFPKKII